MKPVDIVHIIAYDKLCADLIIVERPILKFHPELLSLTKLLQFQTSEFRSIFINSCDTLEELIETFSLKLQLNKNRGKKRVEKRLNRTNQYLQL